QWLMFASGRSLDGGTTSSTPVASIGSPPHGECRMVEEQNSHGRRIEPELVATIAQVLRCTAESINAECTFRELGVDSLMADEIVRRLRAVSPDLPLN